MKLIILLYLYSLNILTNEEQNSKSTWLSQSMVNKSHRRVVGGEDANIKDYPYMVFVIRADSKTLQGLFCGGTIIDAKHILTAAHCVRDCVVTVTNGVLQQICQNFNPKDYVVITGVTNPSLDPNKNSVKQVHIHPRYKNADEESMCMFHFDIAVLELVEPIKFSDTVSPVKLTEAVNLEKESDSKTNTYARERKACTVVGWGKVYEHEPIETLNRNLKVASIPLIDTPSCNKYALAIYNATEGAAFCKDTHICTMDPYNETGICFGDSGGPLICGGEQVGVASAVANCSGPYRPGGFTRTDINIAWLNDIINGAGTFHLNRFLFFIFCLIVNAFK